MTLQVNFNMVSGKTLTFRMEEDRFEAVRDFMGAPAVHSIYQVIEATGETVIINRQNVESITARKV